MVLNKNLKKILDWSSREPQWFNLFDYCYKDDKVYSSSN